MSRFAEAIHLRPELRRAIRATIAFTSPLIYFQWAGNPADALFVAMACQTIALPDLRGGYGMRLVILMTMTLTIAFAAILGVVSGGSFAMAVISSGLIALLGCGWRHLSSDYGPQLSVSSGLLFLIGLSQNGSFAAGLHLVGYIVLGGIGTSLLHLTYWLFRPEHPIRHAVSETWIALADLIASLRSTLGIEQTKIGTIEEKERELRIALDRTFVILGAAENKRQTLLLQYLEEMRREVIHLAMRTTSLHTAIDALSSKSSSMYSPTIDSVLLALGNMARSVAITLLSHRSENLIYTQFRVRRCLHLISILDEQITLNPITEDLLPLSTAMAAIARILPKVVQTLQKTTDRASGEMIPPIRLVDLGPQSIGAVTAWINPTSQLDPALVRHAFRICFLMMFGVAIYRWFNIPHGFWIAFTMLVVLQPDYGSTKQKAVQRIGGTFCGSLLGSALFLLHLPLPVLNACAAAMAFGFAYFVKVRYGIAVFFVTIMLVLMMETLGPVRIDFTITRLACVAAGGSLAIVSVFLFWPIWEGKRFNQLLAEAIRSNKTYLTKIALLMRNSKFELEPLLAIKRKTENANRYAAASLQRLLAEPRTSEDVARIGTLLSTYNQRITRALTAIGIELETFLERHSEPTFLEPVLLLENRLGVLAERIETGQLNDGFKIDFSPPSVPIFSQNEEGARASRLVGIYLSKGLTECQAMALVLAGKKVL